MTPGGVRGRGLRWFNDVKLVKSADSPSHRLPPVRRAYVVAPVPRRSAPLFIAWSYTFYIIITSRLGSLQALKQAQTSRPHTCEYNRVINDSNYFSDWFNVPVERAWKVVRGNVKSSHSTLLGRPVCTGKWWVPHVPCTYNVRVDLWELHVEGVFRDLLDAVNGNGGMEIIHGLFVISFWCWPHIQW